MAIDFPNPKLTSLVGPHGIPTYRQLRQLQREINANACSVIFPGAGRFGLLALTIPTAKYLAVNNNCPFIPPVRPPPIPDYPKEPTEEEIDIALYNHAIQCKAYADYRDTDRALLRQLRDAVPAIYLHELEHPVFEFGLVTTLMALNHLHAQFGTPTAEDLIDNRARMEAPWHPPAPIQALFAQLREGQQFAAETEEPIPDSVVTRIGLQLLDATGLIPEFCRDWRRLPEASKTLAKFRTFFGRQQLDWFLEQTNTQIAGYCGAPNSATSPEPELFSGMALSATRLEKVQKPLADSLATSAQCTVAAKGHRARGYCWTHGHTSGTNHTSASCRFPRKGHQGEATAQNQMGGSTALFRSGHRKRNW
jgi:hypothetical protein